MGIFRNRIGLNGRMFALATMHHACRMLLLSYLHVKYKTGQRNKDKYSCAGKFTTWKNTFTRDRAHITSCVKREKCKCIALRVSDNWNYIPVFLCMLQYFRTIKGIQGSSPRRIGYFLTARVCDGQCFYLLIISETPPHKRQSYWQTTI